MQIASNSRVTTFFSPTEALCKRLLNISELSTGANLTSGRQLFTPTFTAWCVEQFCTREPLQKRDYRLQP